MRRKPFDNDEEGMRVWLRDEEVEQLLEELDGTRRTIAGLLGARCGLRREEIVDVTKQDLVEGRGRRWWLRVPDGKGGKYREVPVPQRLANYVEAWADSQDLEGNESVVGRTNKQVYRWIRGAAAHLQEGTGDVGWGDVTPHDLRRTWGTALLEAGVLPTVVMSWGGWEDWETFREHYLGEFSPQALERERAKVGYLEGSLEDVEFDDRDVVPVASPATSSQLTN